MKKLKIVVLKISPTDELRPADVLSAGLNSSVGGKDL
jgi:hypothetical protein